ncbi:MAG: hypothetical protein P8Y38_08365 [Deltaproteobacteria bacterium]
MQGMMDNMMNDWMKNFDGLKGLGIFNNMDFMKGLNMSQIGRQALDFQKQIFDNTYDMILKIHEQEEKVVDKFMANQTMIPAESQKMLSGWRDMVKKGQDEFKKAVDEGFKRSEALLANFEQFGASKTEASKAQKATK